MKEHCINENERRVSLFSKYLVNEKAIADKYASENGIAIVAAKGLWIFQATVEETNL